MLSLNFRTSENNRIIGNQNPIIRLFSLVRKFKDNIFTKFQLPSAYGSPTIAKNHEMKNSQKMLKMAVFTGLSPKISKFPSSRARVNLRPDLESGSQKKPKNVRSKTMQNMYGITIAVKNGFKIWLFL
jgi:hypothetical protein